MDNEDTQMTDVDQEIKAEVDENLNGRESADKGTILVIGASGVGKSTLINSIYGVEKLDQAPAGMEQKSQKMFKELLPKLKDAMTVDKISALITKRK